MNKLAVVLICSILIIVAILLSVTAAPKEEDLTKALPQQNETVQAISLSPQQKTSEEQQTPQPTVGVEKGLKATYLATIKTTKGDVTVTLISQAAPQTVKNFLEKVEKDFYKNLTFHRVEDWVIQGGDPKGNGSGGGQMQTELSDLPFIVGSLGVARGQDIRVSNASQFFITKTDASWLNQKYTNFGLVTEGMDVVSNISVGDKILKITVQE